MDLVYKNAFSEVRYDKNTCIIWHRYFGKYTHELLVDSHKKVMLFVIDYPVKACFYDLRLMNESFLDSLVFLKNEYEPILKENGVKYSGFVMSSENYFVRISWEQMFGFLNSSIELNASDSIEKGIEWLEEKLKIRISTPEFLIQQ